jgi:tetratricopeptide (TPR) repeat protein
LENLTKAAERLPRKYSEQYAEIYRATGDILAAWGQDSQAAEYFEAALKMDPRIRVKRPLENFGRGKIRATKPRTFQSPKFSLVKSNSL